jgi:hypothetical protein
VSSTIVPLFSFRDQCHWLRQWLDRPPSLDRVDSHEADLYHAVENLMETGEIRLAVMVAWLSILRSSDPTAEILVDIQHAIRGVIFARRPSLLAHCLETPSRGGGGTDAP